MVRKDGSLSKTQHSNVTAFICVVTMTAMGQTGRDDQTFRYGTKGFVFGLNVNNSVVSNIPHV